MLLLMLSAPEYEASHVLVDPAVIEAESMQVLAAQEARMLQKQQRQHICDPQSTLGHLQTLR